MTIRGSGGLISGLQASHPCKVSIELLEFLVGGGPKRAEDHATPNLSSFPAHRVHNMHRFAFCIVP
jgi:hypothetical protein